MQLKAGESTSFALGLDDYATVTNVIAILDGVAITVPGYQVFGPYANGALMRVIGGAGGGVCDVVDVSNGSSSGGAVASVAGKIGAVSLVKADVGLALVDNTADASKPVSTAQAAANAAAQAAATAAAAADATTKASARQAQLVSGTNLRTVNGQTLLGSTDLAIAGSGVTAYAALTDAATVNLPSINTPLATALNLKADALAPVVLTASTAITRTAHLNRPLSIAQAGATTMTFAATATSGAQAGDAFELLNTGAGAVTAAGAITATTGYKLTAAQGEVLSAVYNAATDSFYSTTPSAAAGGGATTYAALTDAATVSLPTVNTPLASALTGKADALAASVLGAGTTNFTRALHFNRPLSVAQAGATSGVFSVAATSGAVAGDAIEILNTGVGTFTASGPITAAAGFKLTVAQGEIFTAVYNSATDSYYSTTRSNSAAIATVKVLAQTAPAVSVAASQTQYCVASIPLPILGPNAQVSLDLDFVLSGANAKTVFVYLSPTAGTVGSVTAPTGSPVVLQSTGSTQISLRMLTGFQNLNSVSSQEGGNDANYHPWSQSGLASRTSAINTGAVSYLNVYVTTGAADTALLKTLSCVGQDPLGL